MSRQVKLSRAFVEDRAGRGLPCGEEVRTSGGLTVIQADSETLQDMMDDAAYQGWHTDGELSIRNAAQAAFRHLHAAGVTYRKGVRTNPANGRAVPGDAR